MGLDPTGLGRRGDLILLTLRWRPSAARASNGEAARMVFVDDVCGFRLCSGLGSFSNGGGEGPSLWVGLPQQRR
jgi:hypothetical protein